MKFAVHVSISSSYIVVLCEKYILHIKNKWSVLFANGIVRCRDITDNTTVLAVIGEQVYLHEPITCILTHINNTTLPPVIDIHVYLLIPITT